MEVIVERCAGLDVHKDTVMACVRRWGEGGRREQEVREFRTWTSTLRELRGWLAAGDEDSEAGDETAAPATRWPAWPAAARGRHRRAERVGAARSEAEAGDEDLSTIPGIATRTAQVVIAEVGVDMTRFPTAKHLASWAGLCPGNREPPEAPLRQDPPRRRGVAGGVV